MEIQDEAEKRWDDEGDEKTQNTRRSYNHGHHDGGSVAADSTAHNPS